MAQGLSEARRECEPAIRLKGHQMTRPDQDGKQKISKRLRVQERRESLQYRSRANRGQEEEHRTCKKLRIDNGQEIQESLQ